MTSKILELLEQLITAKINSNKQGDLQNWQEVRYWSEKANYLKSEILELEPEPVTQIEVCDPNKCTDCSLKLAMKTAIESHKSEPQEEWGITFDKYYAPKIIEGFYEKYDVHFVKDFIRKVREEAIQEERNRTFKIVDAAEKAAKSIHQGGQPVLEAYKNSLREKIKAMDCKNEPCNNRSGLHEGYIECSRDILKLLES